MNWKKTAMAVGAGLSFCMTVGFDGNEQRAAAPTLKVAASTADARPARRVARRTSRRTSRRNTGYGAAAVGVGVGIMAVPYGVHYISALPYGCVAAPYGSITYQHCGSAWNRPYSHGEEVVYVEEAPKEDEKAPAQGEQQQQQPPEDAPTQK